MLGGGACIERGKLEGEGAPIAGDGEEGEDLGRGAREGEEDLFEELTSCRPEVLKVFDVGTRRAG